jgi:hypothetical protein
MADYKITATGALHVPTGRQIPDDMDNRDWQVYQDWLAGGGVPDPADPVPPEPTASELIDQRYADDSLYHALLDLMADLEGVTPTALIAMLKTKLP